ncbi:MAG: HD domain-containing protein [Desulfobacterales bacterium]|nr:HD domain-containing protein [Desulfobacterales bacterium]
MRNLVAAYPVFALENEQLLPAQTPLTSALIEEIASAGHAAKTSSVSMLAHGGVAEDIRQFCRQPPYDVVFSHSDQLEFLFQQMARLRLSDSLIDFLDYFKANDFYTYQHTLTVFALSMLLAHLLEKDPEKAIQEALGAPTHDFGKLCVPLPILQKVDALTQHERRQLEHHALAGYVLLTYYTGSRHNPAAVAARDHHERADGSGYPTGKTLNDRMVEIVAVSDIFDALIAARPYRRVAFDTRTALEQLTQMGEEGKVGWEVIQTLVSCNRKDRPHYSECRISLEKRGTPPPGNLYGVTAD